METSLPQARPLAVAGGTWLRRLTLANATMLLVVVATGATVRLTASGLGCESWPGCRDRYRLPEKDYHSFVEFSNRVVAATTIFVTLATMIVALRSRLPRWAKALAVGTFVGTLAQAPLGALTVHYDLNPWLVMTHFALSLVVVTLGVLLALEAWEVRSASVPPFVGAAGLVVAAACGVLVVTGMLATAAGPHPGSVAVQRLGSFQPAVWLHVRATAVFGIAFAAVLVWLWRRRSPHLKVALLVLGLLAVQMAIGEIQYRNRLPWWLVLGHVTMAATVWAATVTFVAGLWRGSRSTLAG
jgi:cytochrome c oxidase assembly protein subunit 15